MEMRIEKKLAVMDRALGLLSRMFEVVPMGEHAARLARQAAPPVVQPRFTWS